MNHRRVHPPLWVWCGPLLLLTALAFVSNRVDLLIARYYYLDGNFSSYALFTWFYQYGPLATQIAGVGSILYLLGAWCAGTKGRWQKAAWVLLLTLIIGPGLVTNVLLKDHWGRPRPKEVIEFGGKDAFRPFYRPQLQWSSSKHKSFPSGHASMGFYWFTLTVVGWYERKRNLIVLGTFLALSLGAFLSVTRIAQGGHFFSDVLVAGILMWWTAWVVGYFIYREDTR